MHGLFTFTVHSSSGKQIHIAATSHEERLKWLEVSCHGTPFMQTFCLELLFYFMLKLTVESV